MQIDFTDREVVFLLNVVKMLSIKPDAPDAVDSMKTLVSINNKLKAAQPVITATTAEPGPAAEGII
jgi:hypothetical protein